MYVVHYVQRSYCKLFIHWVSCIGWTCLLKTERVCIVTAVLFFVVTHLQMSEVNSNTINPWYRKNSLSQIKTIIRHDIVFFAASQNLAFFIAHNLYEFFSERLRPTSFSSCSFLNSHSWYASHWQYLYRLCISTVMDRYYITKGTRT